jgi:hypothetical protein
MPQLKQPLPHDDYSSQLTGFGDLLKAWLSGAPQDGTSVAELDELIKALKNGHTVAATPERTAKRQVSAQEPVAAKIMRREPTTTVEDAEVAGDQRATVWPKPSCSGYAVPVTCIRSLGPVLSVYSSYSTERSWTSRPFGQ